MEMHVNSHQSGLETWMLPLEMKSPLGPALFLSTHSSLTLWLLGCYRLLCLEWVPGQQPSTHEPKDQCEGRGFPSCVDGDESLEKHQSPAVLWG